MNIARIEQLLNGDVPSVHDYRTFITVAENLSGEMLWQIATSYDKMHRTLHAVVNKNLQMKFPEGWDVPNVDSIYEELGELFSKKP